MRARRQRSAKDNHLAQVLSYLKASDRSLGLLIKFNVPLLRQGIKRVIRTR
jgi:GxxExxY protein